jgi:AhpD family alkylhydroperoxidase
VLNDKEKELVYFGASVASGCKPCTRFHIKKLRKAGAQNDEVEQAITDALRVRDDARDIMESQALGLVGIARAHDDDDASEGTSRARELVSVGAAFAVNCTSNLEKHITVARSIGISDDEIRVVLDAALSVKSRAASYVNKVGQLKEKVSRLQRLLKELEATQAQLVQSEKMAALGKLVAGLAHEMNTPLGAIRSSADVFARSIANIIDELESARSIDEARSSKRFQGSLSALQRDLPVTTVAVERITRIVTGLRGFVHLDEAPFQKADIHECLDSVLSLMDHEFGSRVEVTRDYGNLPLIECYPGELNQVFMNLLTNAVQAIEDTGTITIRTVVKDSDITIQITDSGVGISPDDMQHLFEPNFTRKGARVKASLGLFTSHNIVQKHGGEIQVDSNLGDGSAFTVVLPMNRDQRSKPQASGGH